VEIGSKLGAVVIVVLTLMRIPSSELSVRE
jgi:hypothetical protein